MRTIDCAVFFFWWMGLKTANQSLFVMQSTMAFLACDLFIDVSMSMRQNVLFFFFFVYTFDFTWKPFQLTGTSAFTFWLSAMTKNNRPHQNYYVIKMEKKNDKKEEEEAEKDRKWWERWKKTWINAIILIKIKLIWMFECFWIMLLGFCFISS